MRFHTQTGGVTLAAQQPLNNVVRVTVQTLAATLGGTQSLHTNGYDEALALPSPAAATLALRTQQIVAYESGIAQTVDPLAGSYYVESLTDALEAAATASIEKIDAMGGAERAIERGYIQEEIARSAYEQQREVESGSRVIVGVNRFDDGETPPTIPTPDFSALARDQLARLAAVKSQRDAGRVKTALDAIRAAAPGYSGSGQRTPVMPLIIDAVRARATVGEISDTLRGIWGEYRPG
jgi:methylmalonyl-CoA mutase N-terminal domain/subunit